ncbi:MAG: hypothetical protein OEW08_08740 [Gammaproteobacteria bacterium]|nr:hypothetical protein [Gammaproteobacteria bacterium]
MKMRYLGAVCAGLWIVAPVAGAGAFDLTKLNQTGFKGLSEDLSSALSYKALAPAEPLGITGFDISAEVSFVQLANSGEFAKVLGVSSIPSLPIPKVHLHKGLPFGLDVAAVYMPKVKEISYWGGELRYAILSGNVAMPAIGLRGAYTQLTGVPVLDTTTKSVELGISKGFLMLTPYASLGMVWSTSTPKGIAATAPVSLKEESVSQMKTSVGLNINLGLMNFAGEWDKTGKSNSYSAKFGFRW